MTWVAKLLPKEEQFFPLFEQHAQKLLDAAKELRQLMQDDPGRISAHSDAIARIEKDAKDGARKTLDAVRLTFVTPFNRVDIKGLITEMNRCLREMRKAARSGMLFEAGPFDPGMQQLGGVIVECAELIKRAMPLLPDIDRKASDISAICAEIIAKRDRSDELFDRGLQQLSKHHGDDAAVLIKTSMICQQLEAVMDRLESIASAIHDVVIDQV